MCAIEDLLGRPPVQLDLALVGPTIRDQVVLVTGGAGSIGSELARQIAALRPRTLVLFDQAESALYFTALEIGELVPGIQVVTVVGDITDHRRVGRGVLALAARLTSFMRRRTSMCR